MNLSRIRCFTLIELIVVIAIISVLSVIAVMNISSFMGNSRDANRLATINNIGKALELYFISNNKFPSPDNDNVSNSLFIGEGMGTQIVYKGVIGDGVSSSIRLSSSVSDPSDKNIKYPYSVSSDYKIYQIAASFENGDKISQLFSQVYGSNPKALVEGNYKGAFKIVTGGNIYIANIPSLIFKNIENITNLLDSGTYFVVNKKENIPYTLGNTTFSYSKITQQLMKEVTNSDSYQLTALNITSISSTPELRDLLVGDLFKNFGGTGGIENISKSVLGLEKEIKLVPFGPCIVGSQIACSIQY